MILTIKPETTLMQEMKCEQKADIFKRNPPTLANIQELTLSFILNGNKQSNLLFYNLPIVSYLNSF